MYQNSIVRQLKVIRLVQESKDAKTFVLEPLNGWQPAYKPGQFLTLVFHTEYGEKRRSYSMSSSPATDKELAITIKKLDNGEFSRYLFSTIKEGDVLESTGIAGQFILPENNPLIRQYFFIAAGSGITPCMALIKTLLQLSDSRVTLIYSNKSKEDTIFYTQLHDLQERYQHRFDIKFLFSNESGIYNTRLSSWLLDQLIDQYLRVGRNEVMFYICGPFDYMLTVQITLLSRFPASHIIKEHYSSLPRKMEELPPDTELHQAMITIGGKTFSVSVQYPESILEAAMDQGIQLPYSCKAGRCASCVATCSKGKVWMAYNEVLTDDEVAKGRVLVCQSFPIGGDVEITY